MDFQHTHYDFDNSYTNPTHIDCSMEHIHNVDNLNNNPFYDFINQVKEYFTGLFSNNTDNTLSKDDWQFD